MNPIAYRTTGIFIKTISSLSKARIHVHGEENIPNGSIIFVVNHFTRIETLLLPAYIYQMTHIPTWSLADSVFFKGALAHWQMRSNRSSTFSALFDAFAGLPTFGCVEKSRTI